MKLRDVVSVAAFAGLVLAGVAWTYGEPADSPEKDIVETAAAAGSFETLLKAVQAAGLVETLKAEGPYTVFAPTDEAFAKLPAGTLEDLLKPENKSKLQAILTYHVVPGKWMAADVQRLRYAETANGQRISFGVTNGAVRVGGVKVIQADVLCRNGVIHVIDSVLLPEEN